MLSQLSRNHEWYWTIYQSVPIIDVFLSFNQPARISRGYLSSTRRVERINGAFLTSLYGFSHKQIQLCFDWLIDISLQERENTKVVWCILESTKSNLWFVDHNIAPLLVYESRSGLYPLTGIMSTWVFLFRKIILKLPETESLAVKRSVETRKPTFGPGFCITLSHAVWWRG